MNAQKPGIEWTNVHGPNTGYTWNVIQGCRHDCHWKMPDGTIAECYAKTIADKFRSPSFMVGGFEHHYYHPDRLDEPLKLQKPAGIFLDSFSDLMGHWVPREQILAVLDVCRRAHWHTFQLLTKNAPRLLEFNFPPNVWVGVSMPPTMMFGKHLEFKQREAYMKRALDVLGRVDVPVRWISFEPLSWDVSLSVDFNCTIQWAVIGAATNGNKAYQPNLLHVDNLLRVLDKNRVPVFFKGNLEWHVWREEFPKLPEVAQPGEQLGLF
jgi:protein gp37